MYICVQRLVIDCTRSDSFAKDWPELYKILNYFSFLKASLEDYLTYEETVPILHKACQFKDYQFYKKNDIVKLVQALPDDEFNVGETVHKDPPVRTNTFKDLSPAERGKLNKYTKAMIMGDNRKAAAVGDYVKTILKRDIVPPPVPQPDDMNCAFRAFLMQMPNHEYFFSTETGEVYSPGDLRNQMVVYCVSHAEAMQEKLKNVLDMPFKQWFMLQLDPQQESDHATILALRNLIQVSL